jgi:hypothetical protein
VTTLERRLLALIGVVCFAPAGFFCWWAIVVAGKAFEPYQDNTDAAYLGIAAMLGLFVLTFTGLGFVLLRSTNPGRRAHYAAVAALFCALVPYGELMGQAAYSLNLALVLAAAATFVASGLRRSSNARSRESVS